MICVACGSAEADKGSMKHPYCAKCFQEIFHGDYDAYIHSLIPRAGLLTRLLERLIEWLQRER